MGADTIATIMTVHNRRVTSLACLEALHRQVGVSSVPDVYVVDDGSSDNTAEAIADAFPLVNVIHGDGTLFWAKGMSVAEGHALAADPDLLMWLNDDVVLDDDALRRLLDQHHARPDAVVVGATRDPDTSELTYGGRYRPGRVPQRFAQVPISERVQYCESFNGNCVLVPRNVIEIVGGIDGEFPHAYADDDFGLRCSKAGIAIIQMPGSVGTCSRNPVQETAGGPWKRWRGMQNRKAAPAQAQVRFLRKHGGTFWWAWLIAVGVKGSTIGFRSRR